MWENKDSIIISGSIKNYLFTASCNAALDHIGAAKRKEQMLENQGAHESEAPPDSDYNAHRIMFRQQLYDAIQKLKPKTREIFVLHKIEGLTYRKSLII